MTVRPATLDDAAALSGVQVAAWRTAYASIFPPAFLENLDIPRRRWEAKITAGVKVLVSVEDDLVTGYCSISPAEDAGWAELRAIYVHPESQGRGHGSRLMAAAEELMAHQGFEDALLWVIDRNTVARAFYERRGWVRGSPFRLADIAGIQVTLVRYEKRVSSTSRTLFMSDG